MPYSVIWMRGPAAMGTKSFETLDEATAYAQDNLSQIQANFGATAVKVVDAAGVPHFLKSISRNG